MAQMIILSRKNQRRISHINFDIIHLQTTIAAAHWTVAMTLAYDYFQHRIMCKTADTQYFIMNESTCKLSMIIFVHFKILKSHGIPGLSLFWLLHAKIIATVQCALTISRYKVQPKNPIQYVFKHCAESDIQYFSRWGTSVSVTGSTTSTRNSTSQAYRTMQRAVHVNRGRRSGVIVGSRPLVPASVVPEELISQCQVVLQGKSRNLIIRELQRTVSMRSQQRS